VNAFSLRRFRAMLVKESLQIVRDPSTLLIAFVLPLILLFLFGYAVNLDTTRTRIGLAMLDRSEAATSLADAYRSSRFFDVKTADSVAGLKRDVVADRIRGIVVIPQDFGRLVATRGGADIQVITDGSIPNTAAFVASYADGIRANWVAGRAAEHGIRPPRPPIDLVARYWFNPQLTSRYFLVPGSMAIVLTMIGTLLTSLVIAREWERGTMEAIMATPIGMAELIATKVVPYFGLGLIAAGVCTFLAIVLFQVPFRGSPFALLLIVSAFLVPALGQGLLISAALKNQFLASQVALITGFLPAMSLSGFLFEIRSMPVWIQIVTYAMPVRYLMPLLQSVFLAGDIWPLFIRNISVMLGFGLLLFTAAVLQTRRRIA
jgi:ABC-2 type transport system permease protein